MKLNNYVILFTIYDLIITKSLKLNLIKVREHSGDYWNDMADEIAKNEREIAGSINNRILDIRSLCSLSTISPGLV